MLFFLSTASGTAAAAPASSLVDRMKEAESQDEDEEGEEKDREFAESLSSFGREQTLCLP